MSLLLNSNFEVCYTNEKWLRDGKHLNQLKKHQKFSGDIFLKTLPLCIISPSSILMKRKILKQIGIFDKNFEVCEDYEMWLRLTLNYPIYFFEEKLIIKKGGHADQLSKKYPSMDLFRINALLKLLKNFYIPEHKKKKVIDVLIKKCNIYINGCKKRGKFNEIRKYQLIVDRYQTKQ
jgi:GT2 family glycosyltransferase